MVDIGQSKRTLPGVMGQRIRNQSHTGFRRYLLHNLSLTDARRPHQQHRTLPYRRNPVFPKFIPRQIGAQGVCNLLFGSFNIHWFPFSSNVSASNTTRIPHGGTRSGYPWSDSMTNAV